MNKFILILLSVTLSSIGQVMLKYGAIKSNESTAMNLLKYLNFSNLMGLTLYGLSALLWMVILRKVDLSYAYPMVSLGYILVFIFSYYIFGEPISTTRIVGLAIILLGIVVISRS